METKLKDDIRILREALEYLLEVKDRKDTIGKDSIYLEKQKIAWDKARKALEFTK